MKMVLLLLIACLQVNSTFGQSLPMFFTQEPGSCYAQSKRPAEYKEEEIVFPIYIGDEKEDLLFDTVYLLLEIAMDYLSSSSLDKMFEEHGLTPVFDTILVVDTFTTSDYIMETFMQKTLIKKAESVWVKVICADELYKYQIIEIGHRLKEFGYAVWDNMTMEELRPLFYKFQKDHGLPVGQFDYETIKLLELN